MLNKLREKNNEFLKNDPNDEKQVLIQNILSYDNCFNEMDYEPAFNIIVDLGYNELEAKKIYIEIKKNTN